MPTLDEIRRMFANEAQPLASGTAAPTPTSTNLSFRAFLAAEGQQKDKKGWIVSLQRMPGADDTYSITTSWGGFSLVDWSTTRRDSRWDMFPHAKSNIYPTLTDAIKDAARIIAKKQGKGYKVWQRASNDEWDITQPDQTDAYNKLWTVSTPEE